MDFYWHYSGKETVDAHGKENFCRDITVAKQVFNTLTEYIQVRYIRRLLFNEKVEYTEQGVIQWKASLDFSLLWSSEIERGLTEYENT